jgi:hypothetical protein
VAAIFSGNIGYGGDTMTHPLYYVTIDKYAVYEPANITLEQVEEMREALKWALGESGDFRTRSDGEGYYWWRKELRERAFPTSQPVTNPQEDEK